MHGVGIRLEILVASCLLGTAWIGFADEPLQKGNASGVLVLKSGRIAEGRIGQTAGGYEVEMSSGRMLVPFGLVKLQATSRRDAYEKLRSDMPQQTAEHHVHLADWCIRHEMLDLARLELTDALRQEPEHEQARELLRKLEDRLNPNKSRSQQTDREKPRTFDGFMRAPAKSLAGLSPKAAEQFATRIQPILINKCGNASCHGTTKGGDFSLVKMRGGGTRASSERNLAQVLNQIETQDALQSPLLVVPRGTHGRRGRTIFQGRRGAEQMSELESWVQLVSADQAGPRKSDPFIASRRSPELAANQSGDVELHPNAKRGPLPPDLLDEALRDERPDAFDPNIFNRQPHRRR